MSHLRCDMILHDSISLTSSCICTIQRLVNGAVIISTDLAQQLSVEIQFNFFPSGCTANQQKR